MTTPNTPASRPNVAGIAAKMRNLTESIGNFMGRINPTKLCAADDQQYVAASGALDILEYLAGKVEALEARQVKLEAVVKTTRSYGRTNKSMRRAFAKLAALGDGDG